MDIQMTADEALKLYKDALANRRTHPEEVQSRWRDYTEAVRREMEQKSDGESNMAG